MGGLKKATTEESRTAGGVFFTFLKQDPSVTKPMLQHLKRAEKQRHRDKRYNVALVNSLTIGAGADNEEATACSEDLA